MYCPNCDKEHDGKFCPECGTKLIERLVQSGTGISLGDANAISGGVQLSDSHNVHNEDRSIHNITNTTSTVNNITNNTKTTNNINIHKSDSEILQERKIEFMEVVKKVFDDGILEQDEVTRLEEERIRIGLDEITAKRLIETVRRSVNEIRQLSLTPAQSFMLRQIQQVLKSNRRDQIKRLLPRLEAIAKSTLDEEAHYLYNVALAATDPQKLVGEFESLSADDYWQAFWAYIAYTKLGDFKKAEDMLLFLPRYSQYSEENVTLLAAVGAMREFGRDTAREFLDTVTGMYSNYLENMVLAMYHLLAPGEVDVPSDAVGSVSFYLENILQFEDAEELARREAEERAREAEENSRLYNLRLNGTGPNSFKVAMVIKSELNVSLSVAKTLIEVCPVDLIKQQNKRQLQPLMAALQTAGAEVVLV